MSSSIPVRRSRRLFTLSLSILILYLSLSLIGFVFNLFFTDHIEGYEATHDAKGIAKAYSVSKWMVYRLAEQKRKTGSVALRTSQRGRKPILTTEDKEAIRRCIDEAPDITIEEIREELNLSASYSTVERAIRAMGYTLKKKSLYASERDRLRCAGKTQRMERNHNA